MARKLAEDIHPGLIAATIASAAKNQGYGSQIDGWDNFSSEMKSFLWVRQFHAKDTGALAYIGRSQSWLTKWVNRDTNFKYACQNVRQKAVGVDELPNNELKRVTTGAGRGKIKPKIRPVTADDMKPGAVLPDRRTPKGQLKDDSIATDTILSS